MTTKMPPREGTRPTRGCRPRALTRRKDFYDAMYIFSKMTFGSPVMLVLLAGAWKVCATDPPAAPPGITDNEIREVVARVAKHQIHPLADGDYTALKSVDEARAARAPAGISWTYPWGVALYGLSRSADATGDKTVDQFVVEHNLICARYYAWLSGLKQSVTNSTGLAEFTRSTRIKGLVSLGNLDSC